MKKILIPGIIIGCIFAAASILFISSRNNSKTKTFPRIAANKANPSKVIAVPPAPQQKDIAIEDIKAQLQSVMELNTKINQVQTSRSEQLQRIMEQAHIHQQILETIRKNSTDVKSKPTREALLAQEKLRIIREETLRNKQILDEVGSPSSQRAA